MQALLQQPIELARRFTRCALRYQCTRETVLPRAQRRLGEREVDEIALSETPTAAMSDMAYARQPVNACRKVTAGESKQR